MPVPTAMAGDTIESMVHRIDERWTMAYAAALGDEEPVYRDTRRPDGVVAHPLFAVCPEWPVIVRSRELSSRWGITGDEVARSVHATHDVEVHRLITPGDELRTSLRIVGVEARRPGAFATLRLETVDREGLPVATTDQGSMYLGVGTDGADRVPVDGLPALELRGEAGPTLWEEPIPVAGGAAHTYTECARIWNPIHTDPAVAERAGLPDIILHGTASLALAVSAVIRRECDGDPRRVRRIRGRFRSMVFMPSTPVVRLRGRTVTGDGSTALLFDLLAEAGAPAVDGGVMVLR